MLPNRCFCGAVKTKCTMKNEIKTYPLKAQSVEELSGTINEILKKEKDKMELIDIKYSTSAVNTGSSISVFHYGIIIYKTKNKK